jgi:hypothetical protein
MRIRKWHNLLKNFSYKLCIGLFCLFFAYAVISLYPSKQYAYSNEELVLSVYGSYFLLAKQFEGDNKFLPILSILPGVDRYQYVHHFKITCASFVFGFIF